MNELNILGRNVSLFDDDFDIIHRLAASNLKKKRVLVIGGGGFIGRSLVKLLCKFQCEIDVVDISENNLAELIRSIRSDEEIYKANVKTFIIDVGTSLFNKFIQSQKPYDYAMNLSAIKHVRSEANFFSLARMIQTNILNIVNNMTVLQNHGLKNYFVISTDKAAYPHNIMGATKRLMEKYCIQEAKLDLHLSFARFANVLFSDGSLSQSYHHRLKLNQPLVAPIDIKRYFITSDEAGLICLSSCLFSKNRHIIVPKMPKNSAITFEEIARNFLYEQGLKAVVLWDEKAARNFNFSNKTEQWPLLLLETDTTGEKSLEQFFTEKETVINNDLNNLLEVITDRETVASFSDFKLKFNFLCKHKNSKSDLATLVFSELKSYSYEDLGKYLDEKM